MEGDRVGSYLEIRTVTEEKEKVDGTVSQTEEVAVNEQESTEPSWWESIYDYCAEALSTAWDYTKRAANAVAGWVKGAAVAVKDGAVAVWNWLYSFAIKVVDVIKTGAKKTYDVLASAGKGLKSGAKKTVDVAGRAVVAVKDAFVFVGKKTWELAREFGAAVKRAWERGYEALDSGEKETQPKKGDPAPAKG